MSRDRPRRHEAFFACSEALRNLRNRIGGLPSLPVASLDAMVLTQKIRQVGTPELSGFYD